MEGEQSLNIGRAGKACAARVNAVALNHPEAPAWSLAAWEALSGDGCLLVALDTEGAVCGWVGGTCRLGSAEVETLMVVPSLRRRGIAGELLGSWMRWVQAQGASECLLEVRASNSAALALYQRAGFVVQGRRRRYYAAPEEDALLLRCAVAPAESHAEEGRRGA